MRKNRIDRAVELAAIAHTGQLRKHTTLPYITHPFGVALILSQLGYDEDLIIAGLLHDTVEDSDMTIEKISEEFGAAVAEIVDGCSEPNRSDPWMVRKSHTIEFLRSAPLDTKIVACADKLHNIRSLALDYEELGEEVWERFNEDQPNQEWYYRRLVESLEKGPHSLCDYPIYQELKRSVEDLFRPKS
ncbi:HD domain-containing protein [Acidobacteriota bacterium]